MQEVTQDNNIPELDSVINKMKNVTDEDKKSNFQEENFEDQDLVKIKEEVKNCEYLEIQDKKKYSTEELLKIPADNRNPEQHGFLLQELGLEIYLKMLQEEKEEKNFIGNQKDISTTYKGISAIKKTITQIIIGNQVVRQETEEKAVKLDITTE